MELTTPNKKAIVDFLWEWAESQGDWGKLLISNIVSTENELPLGERQSVFDYFFNYCSIYGVNEFKEID